MRKHEPFRFRNSAELLKKAEELGVSLPFQDEIEPLFLEARIAGKSIPNRIAVQPMEGCDSLPDGTPSKLTFRRYRRYAEGGSGLIWFEACSVSAAGRANPRQLLLSGSGLGEYRRLVETTRNAARARFGDGHDPYLVLQLTHSGRFSMRKAGSKARVACFNPYLDEGPTKIEVLRDQELADIGDQFVAAAALASQAGFDAVDIKACHGYLVNEMLSAFTRKDSCYGGDFAGRTHLLVEIVRRIRRHTPALALAVRLNATDGIPNPFGFGTDGSDEARPHLEEPLRLIDALEDAGCGLLNVTAGIPYYAPHVGRPFDRPARGGRYSGIHPLRSVDLLIDLAAIVQKSYPSLPVVGSGYSWLRQFWPYVGAAAVSGRIASFIGLGRGAFAYPNAPRDLMKHGKLDPAKCCITCSCCTDLMRHGLVAGCAIRDRAIYKKAYQSINK